MADNANGAPHQLHQPLRDGQPEACSRKSARAGGVYLAECLEKPLLGFLGDADTGVAHLKAEKPGITGTFQYFDSDGNLS